MRDERLWWIRSSLDAAPGSLAAVDESIERHRHTLEGARFDRSLQESKLLRLLRIALLRISPLLMPSAKLDERSVEINMLGSAERLAMAGATDRTVIGDGISTAHLSGGGYRSQRKVIFPA